MYIVATYKQLNCAYAPPWSYRNGTLKEPRLLLTAGQAYAPLFITDMSQITDNRPAQTLNEQSSNLPTANSQELKASNQEPLKLLQETQLCGATLSVYGTPIEPLFKAKEVAEIIGLTNPSDLIQRVDEDERAKFNLGRQGETWFLTEQGLYEVLMQSRKPIAKDFKRGVKKILKGIRTGEYHLSNTFIRRTNRLLQSAEDRIQSLRKAIKEVDQMLPTYADSRQLVANSPLLSSDPIAGVEPIRLRGKAWCPLSDLLKRRAENKYPNTAYYLDRYPDRTMVYYRTNYCDEALARYIVAREELRQRQAELAVPRLDMSDLSETKAIAGGDSSSSDVELDPHGITIRF